MKIVDHFRYSEVVVMINKQEIVRNSNYQRNPDYEVRWNRKKSKGKAKKEEKKLRKSFLNSFVSILLIISLILKEIKKVLDLQKWNENMVRCIIPKIFLFVVALGMVEDVPSPLRWRFLF